MLQPEYLLSRIWDNYYIGSNKSTDHPNRSTKNEESQTEHGEGHYGYRSLPLRLADPLRRFSVTLLNDVRPANEHEDLPAAALLLQLKDRYPDLHVDVVVGDSGFGFDSFLHTVYTLPARRVIDLCQHATDRNKTLWPTRGYDDRGRPVCNYGYRLVPYGFDPERQRHKWCCDQACLKGKDPDVRLEQVIYPPPECPYQTQTCKQGRVVDVGEHFADASMRLVRDIPVGSSTWKALYRRARNAVEGRNARLEDWRLKHMPVYGLPRADALIFLADTLDTLTTLARLVCEAPRLTA